MATTQAPASALDTLLASFATAGQNSASSNSSAGLNGQASDAAKILLQSMQGLSGQGTEASVNKAQSVGQTLLRQIMPSVAGSARGAGLYNSTTQKQLLDNTNAQVTAEMSKVLLDQINTNQQLQTQAGSAIGSLNQSTRQETTQKGQSAGDALKGQLGSLLVSQGLGALRKGFGSSATNDILSSGLDAGFSGFALGDTASLGASLGNGWADSLGSAGLSGVTDFTAPVGGGFSEWLGNSGGDITGGIGGIVDAGSGIIDGIGGAIGDAWSGLGSWTGWWANGGRIPGADSTGGKDNKIIGVGGGEVVLPPDTVKALDAKLGEDWVQQLIDSTHTNVRPQPTAAAMAAKNAVSK